MGRSHSYSVRDARFFHARINLWIDTKYLSVNCHIHQNVSASELNQSQPVVDFLAPASAQTAPLGEPAQGAFDDPPTSRKTCFAGNRALLKWGVAAFALVFDMHDVACSLHKLMNIHKIIAFVRTEVLFGVRAFDDNRDHEIICRPLVMLIRAGQDYGQGRAALVHQDVDFAAPFASIGWILPGLLAAQGRGTALTVNRLPFPLDFPFLGVELDHDVHDLVEDTQLLPGLEAFMQRAAAHPKPVFMNCFPLASRPQHIPDPVQYGPVIRSGSSDFTFLGRLRQYFLDLAPQRSGHMKVIDIFRFLGRVFAHVASRFRWVGRTPILYEMRAFFTPESIYG
jgi:hypothetical protein